MSDSLYTTILPGSAHWSMRVRRGMQLRFTDVEGGANLSLLMYNPEDLLERYNAPDTLKGQHTFKLTRGNCLYSDMGRVFASMVDDDFGWHDTVCGTLSEKSLKEKYQVRSYQDCHNQWTLSGEHSFLTELAKYGLGERDLAANLNLFSKVITDDDGNLVFDASAARAGANSSPPSSEDAVKATSLRKDFRVVPPSRTTFLKMRSKDWMWVVPS